MRQRPLLFGIHASPPEKLKWVYYVAPFIIIILGYHVFSTIYLADNPHGKMLPSYWMMAHRMWDLAFTLNIRTHTYLLWSDTAMSLMRFGSGLLAASVVGFLLGINIGLFPSLRYLVLPVVVVLSFVPMLAVLPILLIVFGIGEEMKILLIFLGVTFFITRDIYASTREIPQELLVTSRTLGANQFAYVYFVALPMLMPRLLQTIRLNLGPSWLFLIASESIASSTGLGHQIFILQRYQDMSGIIPYVMWITFLAFIIFYMMVLVERCAFPWKDDEGAGS